MNLEDLAIKYGTDKQKKAGHGYTDIYEMYFEKLRNEDLTFFELGVREGWSIRMWEEYFPNSDIICIDNNAEGLCPKSFDSNRIKFYECSQTDETALKNIHAEVGSFDIIIDDASHISSLTIQSFKILFPMLKFGGLYVIEDMHVCSHPAYNPNAFSTLDFLMMQTKDSDKKINFYLNNKLAVIEKLCS